MGFPHLLAPHVQWTRAAFLRKWPAATIEGVRNQLWLVTVDNPVKGEIPALSAQLSGTRSAWTGMLVWWWGTKIEQFVPGNIDQLLGMETHWE